MKALKERKKKTKSDAVIIHMTAVDHTDPFIINFLTCKIAQVTDSARHQGWLRREEAGSCLLT